MKLRLIGAPTEVADAVDRIRAVLDVTSVSTSYPMRGQSPEVRVYVEVRTGGGAR